MHEAREAPCSYIVDCRYIMLLPLCMLKLSIDKDCLIAGFLHE
jgi:hypothetical protein